MNREGLRLPWSGAAACAIVMIGGAFIAGNQSASPAKVVVSTPVPKKSDKAEASELLVHVSGAVKNPGVYAFKEGDRAQDAIKKAGGVLPGAVLDEINLAQKLQDEQAIHVPKASEPETAPAEGRPKPAAAPLGKISVSQATAKQFEALPGIGPVIAKRIVDFRREHGIRSMRDLILVEGISEKMYAKIEPHLKP